ncbi:DUF2267 domain-containing protein (plasmid) [Synechocystis sp. PCC 7339]|uniref:DUF2267 domain-containing protein n=1 Tax=Synechocystis sp. PCC 7339 TaxID=2782213 RepID=UPI001CBEA1C4|nr:DUF2267 domain-containing protein [Synechocystis sp. PCC 7339]UAJ74613.1 DUF2267 domain-containing protein [Synechocystis sp. PCC 7339]
MPVPAEYQCASDNFYEYLVDTRNIAGLWSTHVAYTMTQGVFQVFRRRLSTENVIAFANVLPVCLRALFVTDWNINESKKPFGDYEEMIEEVKLLREEHNFSPDTAIRDVSIALRKHINEKAFQKVLSTFPKEAADFWNV